jgi:pimeloyl-ACP methyl ester carboxylesterase
VSIPTSSPSPLHVATLLATYLAADAAYVASAIRQTPGPVLAVGHSYAGAVISIAAADAGNVAGLVFVAACAP